MEERERGGNERASEQCFRADVEAAAVYGDMGSCAVCCLGAGVFLCASLRGGMVTDMDTRQG